MMSFEKEINEYERLRTTYQAEVIDKMEREEYRQFNEVLFSTHSCAIEGNSFSVDDTRELKEKGLGMIPAGKTLYEALRCSIISRHTNMCSTISTIRSTKNS